jgi:hypothetical protein
MTGPSDPSLACRGRSSMKSEVKRSPRLGIVAFSHLSLTTSPVEVPRER